MCVQVLQMSLAERGKGEIYQVFAFKFRYSSLFIRLLPPKTIPLIGPNFRRTL
jgi:hypothetical protein